MTLKDVSGLDVEAALAGLVPPRPSVDVTAAFFHRTLARWLGLPEGKPPGKKTEAPLWDYAFWKAEIVEEDGDVRASRRTFTARLYRRADGPAESHRYWLKIDDKGRIRGSGWLSEPPDLLSEDGDVGEGEPRLVTPAAELDAAALAALFADAD